MLEGTFTVYEQECHLLKTVSQVLALPVQLR